MHHPADKLVKQVVLKPMSMNKFVNFTWRQIYMHHLADKLVNYTVVLEQMSMKIRVNDT